MSSLIFIDISFDVVLIMDFPKTLEMLWLLDFLYVKFKSCDDVK